MALRVSAQLLAQCRGKSPRQGGVGACITGTMASPLADPGLRFFLFSFFFFEDPGE